MQQPDSFTTAPAGDALQPHRRDFAVCVGGVSGVGKTTLLKAHVDAVEPRDRQLTGSSVVKAVISPATVHELDGWAETDRSAIREEAIRRLDVMRAATPGRLLVDGHFTLRNRHTGAIEAVFTSGDRAFYDALVLLETSAAQVMAWRERDGRDRGKTSIRQIQEEIDAERLEAMRLADAMQVPLLIIGEADAARRLAALGAFLDAHARLEAAQ